MTKDYKIKIRSTVAAAVAKAGNASILAREIGVSRQQISLWSIRGKLRVENYLGILEYLDGQSEDVTTAVSDFVRGPSGGG